jgi:hypothetical protein
VNISCCHYWLRADLRVLATFSTTLVSHTASRTLSRSVSLVQVDLVDEREVTTQQGIDCAQSLGVQFLETSAKDATNVSEAFLALTKEIQLQADDEDSDTQSGKPDDGSSERGLRGVKESSGSGKKGCC